MGNEIIFNTPHFAPYTRYIVTTKIRSMLMKYADFWKYRFFRIQPISFLERVDRPDTEEQDQCLVRLGPPKWLPMPSATRLPRGAIDTANLRHAAEKSDRPPRKAQRARPVTSLLGHDSKNSA